MADSVPYAATLFEQIIFPPEGKSLENIKRSLHQFHLL